MSGRATAIRRQPLARMVSGVHAGVKRSAYSRIPGFDATVLAAAMQGRDVIVLGSAPLPGPTVVLPSDYLIAVNGAISACPRPPDAWFLNSRKREKHQWTGIRRELHLAMMDQAEGRSCGTVVYMTRQPGSELVTAQWLADRHFTAQRSVVIDLAQRAELEVASHSRTATMRKEAISAGVFAVCFALFAEAAEVRLVGFSYRSGYQYLPGVAIEPRFRSHIVGDKQALWNLVKAYPGRLFGDLVPTVKEVAS